VQRYGKNRTRANWILKRYGIYRRKARWIVKRYGKCEVK
jgi:hypothetical protein